MSEEAVKATEETTEAKPTIMIAQADGGGDAPENDAQPTITTAEESIAESSPEPQAAAEAQGIGDAPETEPEPTITTAEADAQEVPPAEPEDVHYQAVEKEGTVTALWEMQGQKHIRTIDPRSVEGKQILALFETAA